MGIDVEKALGATLPITEFTWSDDDVILYHLGLGAGNPPTDPQELRYTYEGDLHVLPTFATLPALRSILELGNVEGMDVNLASILHGEHEIDVYGPIPTSGSAVVSCEVESIQDRTKGALVVLRVDARSKKTDDLMFTNHASAFIRGEGGFGGASSPARPYSKPQGDPDYVIDSVTLPQQALLYRRSGDLNPLHADPGFAAFAGYDRPILHGLCTYGIVAKAVVDNLLGGDVTSMVHFGVRFSDVVYPGETITTKAWEVEDGFQVVASVASRASDVLTQGFISGA